MKKLKGKLWLPLIALMALAAVFLLLRLSLQKPELPTVTLPAPTASAGPAGATGGEDGLQKVEVTPETVRAVLAMMPRADSYARKITAETFWPGGVGVEELYIWVRGTSERIVVGEGEKNILIVDGTTYIWYDDPLEAYIGKTAEHDAESWQRTESYLALLSADVAITDASYTMYNDEPCIFVAYRTPELRYERRLYVSVGSGLPVGIETWDGDMLTLRITGSDLDISTPGDEYFAAPGLVPVGAG